MKRFAFCALAGSMILAGAAAADDPPACEVEDWRWYHTTALQALGIEGVATCDSGRVTIRAYDRMQDGERFFLGVGRSVIKGRIFKAAIPAVDPRPANPVLEFSLTPEE